MKKQYFLSALVACLTIAGIGPFGQNVCNAGPDNPPQNAAHQYLDDQVKGQHLIGEALENTSPEGVFHLFSHGRSGELLLQGRWLQAPEIAAWLKARLHLPDYSQVNIYGCNFAEGQKGRTAVEYLEATLGVSVAASDDVTGADGDWELEVGTPLHSAKVENYPFNLQTTIFYADFENTSGDNNWTLSPTGTATTGDFAIGVSPRYSTTTNTIQMVLDPYEGNQSLYTGLPDGEDVDGGFTESRSPTITLPVPAANERLLLKYTYFYATDSGTSDDDFFIFIRDAANNFLETFTQDDAVQNKNAVWKTEVVDLTHRAGETVKVAIQAQDDGSARIEAALDAISIVVAPCIVPRISSSCNDNGTSGDTSDDYIEFVVGADAPIGSASTSYTITAAGHTVTALSSPNNYGEGELFRFENGTTGGGDITITITDGTDAACSVDVIILDPIPCAAQLEGCNCTNYLYVNDPALDLIHKFPLDSITGQVLPEIESSPGQPWMPEEIINNPHGVVADLNGNLYIAQINQNSDAASEQLFQVSCDGEVLNDMLIAPLRAYNLVTIGNTLYHTSSFGVINAYDLCAGDLLHQIDLPNSIWGLFLGQDGELYYTAYWTSPGDVVAIYRISPDLSTSTQVTNNYITADVADAALGGAQDEFGNFYLVINRYISGSDETRILKFNSSGVLIDEIVDFTLDMSGFANSWGIAYYPEAGKLYIGTNGDDCVAVIDAGGESGTMTYESALGVPHAPSAYAKAINIVTECCLYDPIQKQNTNLCYSGAPETFFLQELLQCADGTICGGTWVEQTTNPNFIYDDCIYELTVSGTGCVIFSYSSPGTDICDPFYIELEICSYDPPTLADVEVCINNTVTITGSGTPNATNPYVSDDPAVATVNSSGLVTGVSTGTATITYRDDNGCTDDATVTVNGIIEEVNAGSVCNDNGTPSNPDDDTFEVTVNATSIGGAAGQFNVSDGTTTYGPFSYGTGGTIPGFPADGSTVTLTFADTGDNTCTVTADVSENSCSECPAPRCIPINIIKL